MKKIFLAGILVLVVVGCVLAAGCTTTTSNLNPASGTMTDIELTDTATTAPQQVTFTIVESMGGNNYDEMKYRNATITADVGTSFKVTDISPNGFRAGKFTANWIRFNYTNNGQKKDAVLEGTVAITNVREILNYTGDSYSDIEEECASYLYNSVAKCNYDGLYCGGDGIIVTADMDGKTYYI